MKIERRGKYGGVKIHLESEECEELLKLLEIPRSGKTAPTITGIPAAMAFRMSQMVHELIEEDPDVLKDRSDAEIAAILAKESEKARIQLERLQSGKQWQKIDPAAVETAIKKVIHA